MIEAGWDGNAWKERPRKHKFLLGSVSLFFFFSRAPLSGSLLSQECWRGKFTQRAHGYGSKIPAKPCLNVAHGV